MTSALSGKKMVSHSKCKLCGAVLNLLELKEKLNGVGKVCIDGIGCKKRQEKVKQART